MIKLLSHSHINSNGEQNVFRNADLLGVIAKYKGYTHLVLGCHEGWICPAYIMAEIEKKYQIKTIRFAELSVQSRGDPRHGNSHIALINIPEEPIANFDPGCNIQRILPYIKETKCKVILCHPDTVEEIREYAEYIDGYEIANGTDKPTRNYEFRDLKKEFPYLTQFKGADIKFSLGRGNYDLYTELPEGYFGNIYN